jgi:hypothetical protein
MVIDGYFINGYWGLLLVILGYITIISDYCMISYCLLYYHRLLVIIFHRLLLAILGYFT